MNTPWIQGLWGERGGGGGSGGRRGGGLKNAETMPGLMWPAPAFTQQPEKWQAHRNNSLAFHSAALWTVGAGVLYHPCFG